MGIKTRLIEALGGIPESNLDQEMVNRISEAYSDGYRDGNDEAVSTSTGLSSYVYRPIGKTPRDMYALPYEKTLQVARTLFYSNPVAKRAIEIKVDYIVGRGIQIQANDDDLQELINNFNTTNRFTDRLFEYIMSLRVDGVLCMPAFVRKTDGRVKLGFIDPANIETVVTDPENALEAYAVVMKEENITDDSPNWQGSSRKRRVYRIIRKEDTSENGKWLTDKQAELNDWEVELLKHYDLSEYTGSVFYQKINTPANVGMGQSDLVQVADTLDQLDLVLFALAEREQYADFFSFDVAVDGDADDVKRRAREIAKNPPKKGSANVHNKSEDWKLFSPDLHQRGSVETTVALSRMALGGLGLPEHWYGKGDETNRATAQAMGDPTWKSLERAQDIARKFVMWILDFVRDQAIIAGYMQDSILEAEIDIILPQMVKKDLKAVGQVGQTLAAALMVAVEQEWITIERAAEAWSIVMGELGIEYSTSKEREEAKSNPDMPDSDVGPQGPKGDRYIPGVDEPDEYVDESISQLFTKYARLGAKKNASDN